MIGLKALVGCILTHSVGANQDRNANECEADDSCAIDGEQVSLVQVRKAIANTKRPYGSWKTVICPFLATMIKSGYLKTRGTYTRAEMLQLSISAGLDARTAETHIENNFGPLPTNTIDIFDMEGIRTEHKTSTGINDCRSLFPQTASEAACPVDRVTGAPKCPTPDEACLTTAVLDEKFNRYVELADINQDELFTSSEVFDVAEKYELETVDLNVDGHDLLGGSFDALIMVFGETCGSITLASLRKVLLEKEPPDYYVFPQSNRCAAAQSV
eukprot:TRINITY_DN44846_c0_g1_i1.p1 TRINITY_DN44846_c0_g1~~TRINITY_DN44846_c0_g1_i1.p1  ORF type:complete len:272 (-),score=35.37 TRINITY_DN44846_c0_g1_i1:261-1076(-)